MVLVHSMALALLWLIAALGREMVFFQLRGFRNSSVSWCPPRLRPKVSRHLNPKLLAPQVLHVLVPDGPGPQHGARAVPADRKGH